MFIFLCTGFLGISFNYNRLLLESNKLKLLNHYGDELMSKGFNQWLIQKSLHYKDQKQ